jgi:two-component system response regulator YesN
MSKAEFQAIGHLATAFAQHLSDFAHRRVLVSKRGEPSAIRKAKEFIEANTHRRLKLAEVGQHIGLSTGHLCRVFSQTTGMTVIDFVNRVRVERAKDLLLTRCVRAKEAAAQAGFFSIAQFNRAFHAIVGQSPTEFRRSRCQSRGSDSGIRRQAATSQSAHRM